MQNFNIELNSIKDPVSGTLEKWSIPADFDRFRAQILEAFEEKPTGNTELWCTTREALGKAAENWEYHIPHFREFWVRTLVDNLRSQVWCETFDQTRRDAGENGARARAI